MNEQEHTNGQDQISEHEELTRMISPDVLKMNIFTRFISILFSPAELMRNIKTYPVILAPLLICILIGALSIPVSRQWTDMYMQELSHISLEMYGTDLSGWTYLQAADVYGDLDMAGVVDALAIATLAIGVVIGPLLAALLAGLGLWILSKIAKGSSTFGQMFSAYLHIYTITAIGALVSYGLTVMTGNFIDMSSLASVLMPSGNISMPAFNLLSAVSVFSLWAAFLTFVAVKVINNFSSIKAVLITFIAFAFGVAVHVGTFMFTFIMWDISARAMGLI